MIINESNFNHIDNNISSDSESDIACTFISEGVS